MGRQVGKASTRYDAKLIIGCVALGVEQPDYCFSVIINIKVSKVSFMKDFSQVTTLRVTEGAVLQDPTVYINTQY